MINVTKIWYGKQTEYKQYKFREITKKHKA